MQQTEAASSIAPAGYVQAGTVIDNKYVVERVLGEGGMGVVYLARDRNTGIDVVLKAMRAELAHRPDVRERTLSEGRALARIDHPNVVRLNAVIAEGPMLWLVMQYIEGESLDDRIQRLSKSGQRIGVDEALRIFKQICHGVGAAHKEGLIHRDLKPGNVLLRAKDGVAKVSDFGIAKAEDEAREGKGMTKGIVGSLWYMSPEQVRGRRDLDKRVDIYALGVVLYEMLTGRVPFDAESQFEVMRLHAEQPLPAVSLQRPDVPQSIDQIIQRATAKDRDHRYASCEDLVASVEAIGPVPAAWPGAQPSIDSTVPAQMPGALGMPAAGTLQSAAVASQLMPGSMQVGPMKTGPMPMPPVMGPGPVQPTVMNPAFPQPPHPGFGPPMAGPPHTTTGGQALPVMPYHPAPPPRHQQASSSKLPLILVGAGAAVLVLCVAAYKLTSSSDDEPTKGAQASKTTEPTATAPANTTTSTGTAPPSKISALAGRWQVKDSPKQLEAVMSGGSLEFRVVDASQFAPQDYRNGDARFILKPIAGDDNTFELEDHLRPKPPEGHTFDASSRPTCQAVLLTANGQPFRARFDGTKLDVELGVITPDLEKNFGVKGTTVTDCRGLGNLAVVRVSATLLRQ
jgi:serine/threonine-protein kinase